MYLTFITTRGHSAAHSSQIRWPPSGAVRRRLHASQTRRPQHRQWCFHLSTRWNRRSHTAHSARALSASQGSIASAGREQNARESNSRTVRRACGGHTSAAGGGRCWSRAAGEKPEPDAKRPEDWSARLRLRRRGPAAAAWQRAAAEDEAAAPSPPLLSSSSSTAELLDLEPDEELKPPKRFCVLMLQRCGVLAVRVDAAAETRGALHLAQSSPADAFDLAAAAVEEAETSGLVVVVVVGGGGGALVSICCAAYAFHTSHSRRRSSAGTSSTEMSASPLSGEVAGAPAQATSHASIADRSYVCISPSSTTGSSRSSRVIGHCNSTGGSSVEAYAVAAARCAALSARCSCDGECTGGGGDDEYATAGAL